MQPTSKSVRRCCGCIGEAETLLVRPAGGPETVATFLPSEASARCESDARDSCADGSESPLSHIRQRARPAPVAPRRRFPFLRCGSVLPPPRPTRAPHWHLLRAGEDKSISREHIRIFYDAEKSAPAAGGFLSFPTSSCLCRCPPVRPTPFASPRGLVLRGPLQERHPGAPPPPPPAELTPACRRASHFSPAPSPASHACVRHPPATRPHPHPYPAAQRPRDHPPEGRPRPHHPAPGALRRHRASPGRDAAPPPLSPRRPAPPRRRRAASPPRPSQTLAQVGPIPLRFLPPSIPIPVSAASLADGAETDPAVLCGPATSPALCVAPAPRPPRARSLLRDLTLAPPRPRPAYVRVSARGGVEETADMLGACRMPLCGTPCPLRLLKRFYSTRHCCCCFSWAWALMRDEY